MRSRAHPRTYIDEGITDAANRHASLILITMDTPGGLSDS